MIRPYGDDNMFVMQSGIVTVTAMHGKEISVITVDSVKDGRKYSIGYAMLPDEAAALGEFLSAGYSETTQMKGGDNHD